MQPYMQLMPTIRRHSVKWAWILTFQYVLYISIQLSATLILRRADGTWEIHMLANMGTIQALVLWGNIFLTLLTSTLFFIALIRDRRISTSTSHTQVNGTDFIHAVAFMQVFYNASIFLYGTGIVTYPLFTVGSIGGLLESASLQIVLCMFCFIWFRGRLESIGFKNPTDIGRMFLFIIGCYLGITFLLSYVVAPLADLFQISLSSAREEGISREIKDAKQNSLITIFFSFFMTGIFVPIAEEMMFRGVLQTYLVKKWGALWGILIASFWFAIIHIDLALFLPLFMIGLSLGIVRHRFHSLWASIILHSINNVVSVILSYQS
ncbi:CPBP family intramembrane glutamic endopeptidase [Brevibacillus laterosporus]|uniref:CPBP family intramembrane metalloprotease domain-containing protein n=1 Tax=Brevibacillus laterosporus TaxID=1465 RepID=A0AAP3GDM0_BRELA|nr:type II CAAX endopeptidase family protein [Brevibacillus laterosporus]MCR8981029.1 CPBP family intramembrane metalloprotease [Brevibacillus laterosporus]MCZ0808184.1 type II CAAX endopeptidase family protein [Brevibacillus laterosporus]MCZ0826376.1 type II CAAX endopeptidase family protein [Brevibacillus laterosporus]MCZ0850259.1 type II CAAX endopeptidase family protein [Brevibacillus laterosporus]MED1663759.1 type II CAAX endopeptidase family protein [Brevibacillus laterosporus]